MANPRRRERKSAACSEPAFLDLVRTALHYVPETGELVWLVGNDFVQSGAIAGSVKTDRNGYKYLRVRLDGAEYVATHLIWLLVTGTWPRHVVDHENRDSLDNRWANLRHVTSPVNARNRG